MSTIRAATEACIHSFAVVCHEMEQHLLLEASACDEIRQESGRFRVWTGNLGALAKGHSALDWRLRDADVMRFTVLSLLEELQNTLELASALVRGEFSEVFLGAETYDDEDVPDDISLPSDDGLDVISQHGGRLFHLSQRVQDLVKDLYKLSFRIRHSTSKPARAVHYKEIDTLSGLDLFGDCFAALDQNHVSELFRSLRQNHAPLNEDDHVLVQRLAKANTARRRQFRYWQRHAQKLAIIEAPQPVIPMVATLEFRKEPPTMQIPPKPATNTQSSQSHQGKTIFTTTEATFFDPKLDLTTLETQSVISSATTSRDLEGKPADLPPPPAEVINGQDFVCPYCFVLCPSAHGHGRAWRKHILQDLQPYSCTYTNCSSADRLYGSRREWLEHEESQHRKIWICRFHPSLTFPNQQDFEHHLHEQDHGHVTEAQIKDFASIAQSCAEDARQTCPICLEETTSIPLFPAHLAHHLERTATFSLPREVDDEHSTSLASFRAVPRSMSDRPSISSDSSVLSLKNSVAGSHLEYTGQSSLEDDIVQWFQDVGVHNLGPPEQLVSSLDAATLYAFQESPEYTLWYSETSPRRLVCRAETNARKTTFSSAVYQDLKLRTHSGAVTICAFLPDKHGLNLTLSHILIDLVRQLIAQNGLATIYEQVLDFYTRLKTLEGLPSSTTLIDLVHSLRDSIPRVFLIIDNPSQYNNLLPSLFETVSRASNVSLLVTSSHQPFCLRCERNILTYWRCEICSGGQFELCTECKDSGRGCHNTHHRLFASQDDQIMIDIDALYSLDHRKRSLSRAMNSKIVEIQTGHPHDDQRQSLLIDEAFERIMSHTIKSSEHEDLAMAAFDVVRHAFSPLKDIQFKTAVHHVLQSRRSSPPTHPTMTDVIGATGGLLILQQDSVITWFNPSLSGYFERSCARWFPSGHASMALSCLTVLMTQTVPTDHDQNWDWARDSFFAYASCSWGRHLRACSPNQILEDMAFKYLEDDKKLELGTEVAYFLGPKGTTYGSDNGLGLTAAHVCSIFGLTNLLPRLPYVQLSKKASFTGQTPLVYACKSGHLDTVEFLLDCLAKSSPRNAGVMMTDAGLSPALREASASGQGKIVQLLLQRGADVNAKDETTKSLAVTPLMFAFKMGHTNTVKTLLDHGADMGYEASGANFTVETPLILACRHGHTDVVRLLLEHGADPNAEDLGGPIGFETTRGRTLLTYACQMDRVDIVKLLLEHGADPSLESIGSSTALHEAIKLSRVSVVETLLRSPDVKLTPMTSGGSGEDEIVLVLLSLLRLGSLDVLRLALARNDLDLNEKDHNGRTVVWWLLRASHDKYDPGFQEDALRLIVQHPKCDVNAADLGGRTYVMRFLDVRIQNIRLLKVLLENNADVNRLDEDGESAIFHAVTIRYSLEVTSLLIRHGADLSVKNRWGQSLTHRLVADMEDTQDLQYLDLLLERMPTLINARDDRGRTPLHLALVYGKTQLAQELLAQAADVNLLDNFGRAPFDVACQYGRITVLPELPSVGIYEILAGLLPELPDVASRVRHSAPDFDRNMYLKDASTATPDPRVAHQKHSLPPFDNYSFGSSNRTPSWNNTETGQEGLGVYAYQSLQPTEFPDDETSGLLAGFSHTTDNDSSVSGQARLEMQLDKLPAWSLGYQGRFDKLLARLQADGIDPLEASPDDGNTALHTVIKSVSVRTQWIFALKDRVFRELLDKVKPFCSPQNGCQETPLHTAILASQTKVAIILIKAGANLGLRDNLERTPLDLAKELEQDDVVAAIQEALANDAGGEHHEVSQDRKAEEELVTVAPPRSSW